MKKITNLKGIKPLTRNQQKKISGSRLSNSYDCRYLPDSAPCPNGCCKGGYCVRKYDGFASCGREINKD